ncbi:DMT family transporter [Balneolales bacterium ANBcel1]|nr:DMT family transporter [Balneolales bacterium ANBcel1]
MSFSPSQRTLAEISLAFIVIVWALNFSVVKYSLDEIDPLSFNAFRFFLAILLMWTVVRFRRLKIRIAREDFGKIVLLGILGNLLYQMLFIIGIDRTFASNAAVMLGLIPVWIAIFSHLFTPEKMYRTQFIGVTAAFAGVALIMGGGEDGITLASESFAGDLIMVSAAMVFAAYTLLARSMLEKYSPLTLATSVMTVGGTLLIVTAIPSLLQLDFRSISRVSYAGAAYSGTFAIGLAYLIWNFGIKNVGAIRTAAYQNLVPVLGVLFGLVFLGEKLHLLQYLGCLLTIGGIVLTRIKKG